MVDVCILRMEGTNNEYEVFNAFRDCGATPHLVHLNELSRRQDLFDYKILMIPGGFSAGDYVRAGAIFASRIKATLWKPLTRFINEGYPVGGICNGFQVLVELGLLPGNENRVQACLTTNDSNRFECRPVFLAKEKTNCVFTSKVTKAISLIPVAHAEGKFMAEKGIVQKMEDNRQIVFRYSDERGTLAGYPWNPNGSPGNIAGVCNPAGNVFGMMPHPERAFHSYLAPDWTRCERSGDGRAIIESVIEYARGL